MAKAFVSYSRKDTVFTRRLADCLSAENYELWIDWESIPPTVDWKSQIQKGVEEADTFLFLISPDSIKSTECAEELMQAVKNGKRLIPLVVREINADDAPKELKHINWIFFTKEDEFDKSFNKLLEAINTDYDWVQTHRRLQVKALEWDRAGRENSFLLRGKDLEFAEGQLVVNASKDPKPTDLQREFILKSRKASARQRRITTIFLGVAALVMLGLAVYASNGWKNAYANEVKADQARKDAEYNAQVADANAKQADTNAQIARIGELSALGVTKIGQDYNDALLLSVEAYRRAKDTGLNMESAESALLSVLQSRRGVLQVLLGHNDWVTGVDYSLDGKSLVSSSYDDVTYLWDASDPQNPVQLKELEGDGAKFSPDNTILATSNSSLGLIKLWDISNRANPFEISEFSSTGINPGDGIIGFTSNGHSLITRSSDESGNHTIEVWDISNPQSPASQYTFPGESAGMNRDGSILTINTVDEAGNPVLTLWNISDPLSPVQLSSLPVEDVSEVAFSSDGNILAILGYDSAITLWDLSNVYAPVQLGKLSGYSEGVSSIVFDPSGLNLVLGGTDGKVLLWYVGNSQSLSLQPYAVLDAHSLDVDHMAFNKEGTVLVSGGNDGMIMLWDTKKLNNPLEVEAPSENSISSSPDGKYIAAQDYDPESNTGSTVIWDVTDSTKPVQTSRLDTFASSAGFSPDSQRVVTGSTVTSGDQQTNIIQLWDVSDPKKPVSSKLEEGSLNQVVFSPNSTVLITSSDDPETGDSVLTLWDLSKPESPTKFGLVKGGTGDIVFSTDGKMLAIPSYDNGEVGVWDTSEAGKFNQVGSFAGGTIAFSPDGQRMAVSTSDPDGKSIVDLWEIAKWKDRKKLSTLDGMDPVFSPNGKLLVTDVTDETNKDAYNMMLWNLSDPSRPTSSTLTGHFKPITSIAFRPDSSMFASASNDKTIILWDVSNPDAPQKGMTLNGHSDWIRVAAFNSDGTELASGGLDRNVILWKVNSFKDVIQLATLKGSFSNITSLAFTDNERLISNDQILWNLDPASWVTKACHLVGSNFSADKWNQLFPNEKYRDTCENLNLVSAPEPQPEPQPVSTTEAAAPAATLSACTNAQDTLACPLVQASEPTFLNRFCVDEVSYTLYAVPEGTTLTPADDRFKCTDQGVHGGKQQYSCYGPPESVFPANMCSTTCAIPQSDQCEAGFGLDPTQSCCVPIPSNISPDGCVQVNLEIKPCNAQ
jgi:WD40 repeat protein